MRINIDFETFSSVDLKKCGVYKYVASPDFEIMLTAYSIDGGPVRVFDNICEARVDALFDKHDASQMPEDFYAALINSRCEIHAFNAQFERLCIRAMWGLDIPLERFRCTMVHSLYCGLPARLSDVCEALGFAEDRRKMYIGSALIRTFCVPKKPPKPTKKDPNPVQRTRIYPWDEPEKWADFKAYNLRDVEAELEVSHRLEAFPVPPSVWAEWRLDQLINDRGARVDMQLVDGAIRAAGNVETALTAEAVQISGLDKPNSQKQLLKWLQEELDSLDETELTSEDVADLKKETVKELLATGIPSDKINRMLEIRQLLSKTSTKKYITMKNTMCADDRVRGLFQFYGANRTGRFAGRLVQVQNLPRNDMEDLDDARRYALRGDDEALELFYGSVPDTLSQLIRTAFVPAEGTKLIVSDFSAIEARVIAWLAKEQWVMDVFATHGKIYEATASQMFGVPLERIKKGNPEYDLRQRGKVAQLACGYQGGPAAMERMDTGHKIDPALYPELVEKWRAANPNIVTLWDQIGQAALWCVRSGLNSKVNGIRFDYAANGEDSFLTVTLPSGRKLYYYKPHLTPNRFGGVGLGYWGLDQMKKKWLPDETYGGKLVENIVQAIARDCLVIAMRRLEAAGYRIVMHVHDEVIIEATPDQTLDAVNAIMAQPISWAPGLILKAAGSEMKYYQKD